MSGSLQSQCADIVCPPPPETTAEAIFQKFTESMADIYASQRDVKSTMGEELKKADAHKRSLSQKDNLDRIVSSGKMTFKRFCDGQMIIFSYRSKTIDERIEAIFLHKNRQYQWLLAEAYEVFEDFIEELYAFVGYSDPQFWPLSDFGDITFSEIPSKNLDWFKERSKNKKNSPKSSIELFRTRFPDIKKLESGNHKGVNINFMIKLVERMRHIIVHNKGQVSDIDEFAKKLLTSCGLYNNGNPDAGYSEIINGYFFFREEHRNKIGLLEIPLCEAPLPMYLNKFEDTCGYLLGYAHIITCQVTAHLNEPAKMPTV